LLKIYQKLISLKRFMIQIKLIRPEFKCWRTWVVQNLKITESSVFIFSKLFDWHSSGEVARSSVSRKASRKWIRYFQQF